MDALHPLFQRGVAALAVLGVPALLYAALLGTLYVKQESLLFLPEPLPAEYRHAFGDDVHAVTVDVPGAQLAALHLRLSEPRGVVFYLHGNAGNLRSWFSHTDVYRRAGFDLFMIDYRGYGQSTGRIESEAQLHADVRAAWDSIAPRYAGKARVVLGRSLGTGLAVALAREVQPELTVLVSPYRSLRAAAADHYPYVPGALLRYPMDTEAWIGQLQGDVLLVHGAQDTVIAPHHSEALQARAPRSRRVLIEGAGHNDLQAHAAYFDAISAALAAARPGDAPASAPR